MSNEFDYSGLYNNHATGEGASQGNAPAEQPGTGNPQNSYPNVGSSGMNTANTARTDYSAPQQDGGYTSSFSGGNGGGNGGYNGYSYASAPQQQPPKPKKKHPVLLRVVAVLGVVVLGFGSGVAGAVMATRTGLTGSQVVVQQIQRDTPSDATNTNSTDGTAMSVQQIASVVSPSVVAITTEQMSGSQTWFGGYYVQSGAGSGVIISQDGYILTCAHVVSGATSVKVQLDNGDSYDATIVGSDSTSDIAVIKIEATGLTPAVIGDSDALAVGEVVVAVGNPLGTLSNSVTDGIISALNREVTVEDNEIKNILV